MKRRECPICPDSPCTPEYHAASASIHEYLRAHLLRVTEPPPAAVPIRKRTWGQTKAEAERA